MDTHLIAHPGGARRPNDDVGIRGRSRRSNRSHRAPRPHALEGSIPTYLDTEAVDASELDRCIEERFQRERIEGGVYVPLGEDVGNAIYHARGERA